MSGTLRSLHLHAVCFAIVCGKAAQIVVETERFHSQMKRELSFLYATHRHHDHISQGIQVTEHRAEINMHTNSKGR